MRDSLARGSLYLIEGGKPDVPSPEQLQLRLSGLRDLAYEALLDRDWTALLRAADELLRAEASQMAEA